MMNWKGCGKFLLRNLPFVLSLTVCAVGVFAQSTDPLSGQYAPKVSALTNSILIRRILGLAIAGVGIGFATASHSEHKKAIAGTLFAAAVMLNGDLIADWMPGQAN